MRLSKHVGNTLKETPREGQVISHKLMLRGGYMKQLSAGIYTYMPILFRTLQKISQIVHYNYHSGDNVQKILKIINRYKNPVKRFILYTHLIYIILNQDNLKTNEARKLINLIIQSFKEKVDIETRLYW